MWVLPWLWEKIQLMSMCPIYKLYAVFTKIGGGSFLCSSAYIVTDNTCPRKRMYISHTFGVRYFCPDFCFPILINIRQNHIVEAINCRYCNCNCIMPQKLWCIYYYWAKSQSFSPWSQFDNYILSRRLHFRGTHNITPWRYLFQCLFYEMTSSVATSHDWRMTKAR